MPTMISELEQHHTTTDQTLLLPVARVFEEVTARPVSKVPSSLSPSTTASIQELFPEQEYEERNFQKAKQILGELANNFSQSELRDIVAQVEYLAESWLDDFERDIFEGKTLNEVLHEKGGI